MFSFRVTPSRVKYRIEKNYRDTESALVAPNNLDKMVDILFLLKLEVQHS